MGPPTGLSGLTGLRSQHLGRRTFSPGGEGGPDCDGEDGFTAVLPTSRRVVMPVFCTATDEHVAGDVRSLLLREPLDFGSVLLASNRTYDSRQHRTYWREKPSNWLHYSASFFFFHFHGNHKIVFVFQIKHVSEQRVHYPAVLKAITYHCSDLIPSICSFLSFHFCFGHVTGRLLLDISHLEKLQKGKYVRNIG